MSTIFGIPIHDKSNSLIFLHFIIASPILPNYHSNKAPQTPHISLSLALSLFHQCTLPPLQTHPQVLRVVPTWNPVIKKMIKTPPVLYSPLAFQDTKSPLLLLLLLAPLTTISTTLLSTSPQIITKTLAVLVITIAKML